MSPATYTNTIQVDLKDGRSSKIEDCRDGFIRALDKEEITNVVGFKLWTRPDTRVDDKFKTICT
jgi:hypothetical protein